MRRKNAGFTLVEILVVIAIIAILAAILFPVLARVRAKAQQASCLSNVRQLQMAMAMYAGDYDMVHCPGVVGAGYGAIDWVDIIYPYVKSAQVYVCPSDPNPGYLPHGGRVRFSSYGLNQYAWDRVQVAWYDQYGNVQVLPLPPMELPTEMLELGETGSLTVDFVARVEPNHDKGANFAFMDGHAKWLPIAAVPTLRATPPPASDGEAVWHFWYGIDPPV